MTGLRDIYLCNEAGEAKYITGVCRLLLNIGMAKRGGLAVF
jgi:hypothetical protein